MLGSVYDLKLSDHEIDESYGETACWGAVVDADLWAAVKHML